MCSLGHDISTENPLSALKSALSQSQSEPKTFKDLGLDASLCDVCAALGYSRPTPIQAAAIPSALKGRDIIGISETGSGKTASFALPILQTLLTQPQSQSKVFGLVLSPTRELAVQTAKVFSALGSLISLRCSVIVGGLDMTSQAIDLAKRPHIVVATPGRLLDHLQNTKGFSLSCLKYLVIDEADRLLDMDFGPVLEQILKLLPHERNTFLFSATISSKIKSLERACLRNPLCVDTRRNEDYQIVANLKQYYIFIPEKDKDLYLAYLTNKLSAHSILIFTRTIHETQRISLLLRKLGFITIPLHGALSQPAHLAAINKIKAARHRTILVATDIATRGLDIPNIGIVINYDLPQDSKTYVHRVGRTARAGKSGCALNIITQNGVEMFLRIENVIGKGSIVEYEGLVEEEVEVFKAAVDQGQSFAVKEMRGAARGKYGGRTGEREGERGGGNGG